MDLIDCWTKYNTREKKQQQPTCTHQSLAANECDRDGQQRRLYASIEQININVHWMEIWQHIFLSDNMKYGNSPQHSTDSQRQTYTRQHGWKVSPKEPHIHPTRSKSSNTNALDRMYQMYSVTPMLWARSERRERERKVCGCITAAASMAAMAATIRQYLR